MPRLDVDREAVRALALAVGIREAARRMKLPEDTVKKWSTRGKWLARCRPQSLQALPASMEPRVVPDVPTAAEALAEMLADDERETRVSLSRSARNMAAKAETAELTEAPHVLSAAKVAALVHRWNADTGAPTVSIAILLQ